MGFICWFTWSSNELQWTKVSQQHKFLNCLCSDKCKHWSNAKMLTTWRYCRTGKHSVGHELRWSSSKNDQDERPRVLRLYFVRRSVESRSIRQLGNNIGRGIEGTRIWRKFELGSPRSAIHLARTPWSSHFWHQNAHSEVSERAESSMFNDIDWTQKGNSETFLHTAKEVAEFKTQLKPGHWCFLGPASETWWNGHPLTPRTMGQYRIADGWHVQASLFTSKNFQPQHHCRLDNLQKRGINYHFQGTLGINTMLAGNQLRIYKFICQWYETENLVPTSRTSWE